MLRLMILLALLCPANVIAQSQIHQNAVPDNAKNASAQEQPGTIKAPYVVTISPPSDAEKKASDERQQRKEELDSRLVEYTKDLSIFTKVLAGAAFLQLFVFGYQAWKLNQTVIATKASADAALKTAKNMEAAERAYVQMSHMPPGLEIQPGGGKCRIQMRIKNFGRTPARITGELLNISVRNKGERLPQEPDYKIPDGHELIAAFLLTGDEIFAPEVFEDGGLDIPKLKSGEKVLWLFGYVDYIDQFDGHHRAGWARRYIPGPQDETLAYITQDGYNYDRPRKKGEGNDWNDPI